MFPQSTGPDSATLTLALQHHQAGRLAEAEALYRQFLAVQPNHPGALHLLGVLALQFGHHENATELIRQAIAFNPNDPAAHSDLGEACRAMGRLDEAVASYRRAIALQPDYADAYNNLGLALATRGRLEEAATAIGRALELNPGHAQAHSNLGATLAAQGRREEAVAAYRRALELRPDYAAAHYNLGYVLSEQGQWSEAVSAFRRALESRPNYPEACNNMAIALAAMGQSDEALAACRTALELQPSFAEAHNNLGNVFQQKCQLDEAIASYRRALQFEPGHRSARSNLIFTLQLDPSCDPRTIGEEQQRWNRQFSDPLKQFIPAHGNDRSPDRRLRIGYVSADFRAHVVGRNLAPLFRSHDRRECEILCYSGVTCADQMTEEFRRRADQWRSTVGVGDEALADMIRRDGVDLLVDLSQHTDGNRLTALARLPAPVQVSFAGYPASTGLEAIEYRISDRWLEAGIGDRSSEMGDRIRGLARSPRCRGDKWEIGWKRELRTPNFDLRPATQEQVFLLESFWCYDPCGAEVEVNELPAAKGEAITFGCLNNFCKINEPVLKLWARVLGKVPQARLVMLSALGSHRQRTVEFLEREGVAALRVEFVEPRPREEYLKLYHRLDMVLDTFPYNGHTTSLDALWMGVPVVSLAGKTAVSRAGLSQLSNLGLSELVAHTEEDFIEIARRLANDLPRLAELRRTLRARMEASVLMDAPRFARSIETAYRAMWREWCSEIKPSLP